MSDRQIEERETGYKKDRRTGSMRVRQTDSGRDRQTQIQEKERESRVPVGDDFRFVKGRYVVRSVLSFLN